MAVKKEAHPVFDDSSITQVQVLSSTEALQKANAEEAQVNGLPALGTGEAVSDSVAGITRIRH